jgi:hypothetical protein
MAIKTLINALETVKANRNITDTTYDNYTRYALYIYRIATKTDKSKSKTVHDIKEIDYLQDEETLNSLKEAVEKKTSLRAYLNTMFVLLQVIDQDSPLLLDIKAEITLINQNEFKKSKYQLKSDKEQENWLSWGEVKKFYRDLTDQYTSIKKKKNLDTTDLEFIQKYTLLSCYMLIPPRRLMDFARLYFVDDAQDLFHSESVIKLSDLITVDEVLKKNNYVYKDTNKKFYFVFNQYKTSKLYGSQKFEMPFKLGRIFTYWFKVNRERLNLFYHQNTYPIHAPAVFLNSSGLPMSSVHIGKSLSSLFKKKFDKNISAGLLRHIYISHFLKDSRTLHDRQNVANKMGHSPAIAEEVYRKLDGAQETKNKLKMELEANI